MNIACRVENFYIATACVAAVLYAAVSIFDFVFRPVPQTESLHCLVMQQDFGCEFALLARQGKLIVDERVVETDVFGVGLVVGEIHFLESCPVDCPQTHGAWLA